MDQDGLYYYNARYYDVAIGRFISADTVVPDFANPQSLNRYSYCYNNPLAYIDPTGHWGWSNIKKWSGNRANDVRKAAKVAATVVTDNIDTIQMAIDVAGLIPVVGEAFDAANAAIYTARGDYVSAGLSLAACVPMAGSAATAAKLAKNTVKAVDKAQALGKVGKGLGVAEGAMHQVTKNKIAGDAFRDEIANALKATGRDVKTEVWKKTPFGRRRIDIEVKLNGKVLGGIECKTGGSRYLPLQRLKDAWLQYFRDYPVNVVRPK